MTEDEVRHASARFYEALNAMFTGDMGPMTEIWSHADDVTNLGPFGDRQEGWEQVRAQFEREAALELGGRVEARELLVRAGSDLGYSVCIEEGENSGSGGEPIRVRHRATNVFRREAEGWKLVHHHTDLAPALQQTAAQREG